MQPSPAPQARPNRRTSSRGKRPTSADSQNVAKPGRNKPLQPHNPPPQARPSRRATSHNMKPTSTHSNLAPRNAIKPARKTMLQPAYQTRPRACDQNGAQQAGMQPNRGPQAARPKPARVKPLKPAHNQIRPHRGDQTQLARSKPACNRTWPCKRDHACTRQRIPTCQDSYGMSCFLLHSYMHVTMLHVTSVTSECLECLQHL